MGNREGPSAHSRPARLADAKDIGLCEALTAALSQVGDATITTDPAGAIELMNAEAQRLTGWPLAEAMGQLLSSVLRMDGVLSRAVEQARHANTPVRFRDGASLTSRDGSVHLIDGSVAPMHSAEGHVDGVVLVFRDVTDRKQAETQRRLQSAALEAAANGVAITDTAGTLLWVNAAFSRMTGYSAAEAIGQNPRILKSGRQDEEFYRKMWQTIRRGQIWHGDLINRRKNGTVYHEEMTIAPVPDNTGQVTHYIAIKQDITERRKAEDAARAARVSAETAKAEAESANRAKDHFLAVLSHELRTPLTPILATVSMLQAEPPRSEPNAELRENLELIRRNVELEARLIDDLLDLTRITRGKIELNLATVNVHEQIDHVLSGCQDEIRAKPLHLSAQLGAASHHVRADSARLQQILWNILRNAIKFTPAGGRITVRTINPPAVPDTSPAALIVEVIDTGIGIEPDRMARIFTAFEQGGREISRMFGGLGLGLSISRGLAELHGGLLSAYSEGAGRGATFRLQLPLCPAPIETGQTPAQVAPHSPRPAGGKVLLIEDHADTAKVLARILIRFGYDVRIADGVAAGVRAARATRFDLLISDIGLPDGSGLDLIRQITALYPVPSIALSGYGQEEDIRRSRDAGFSEHLTKPVDVRLLKETLERLQSRVP